MPTSLTRPPAARRAKDADHNKRRMITLMQEIENQEESIRQGSGPKGVEAQHRNGWLTARERIEKLVDPADTRSAMIWALEAASLNPEVREFRTGVLQT